MFSYMCRKTRVGSNGRCHMSINTDYGTGMREHAWRYFELHAGQRLTLFNYFLVVSGAIAAGLAATLQGTQRFAAVGVVLGLLLVLVSFIFWKLDQRSSFLVKHAESALAKTEQAFSETEARLFAREPHATCEAAKKAAWWSRHWSYGDAFRFVFIAMAIFGVVGSVVSGFQFSGMLSWQAK